MGQSEEPNSQTKTRLENRRAIGERQFQKLANLGLHGSCRLELSLDELPLYRLAFQRNIETRFSLHNSAIARGNPGSCFRYARSSAKLASKLRSFRLRRLR